MVPAGLGESGEQKAPGAVSRMFTGLRKIMRARGSAPGAVAFIGVGMHGCNKKDHRGDEISTRTLSQVGIRGLESKEMAKRNYGIAFTVSRARSRGSP